MGEKKWDDAIALCTQWHSREKGLWCGQPVANPLQQLPFAPQPRRSLAATSPQPRRSLATHSLAAHSCGLAAARHRAKLSLAAAWPQPGASWLVVFVLVARQVLWAMASRKAGTWVPLPYIVMAPGRKAGTWVPLPYIVMAQVGRLELGCQCPI